MKSFSRVLLAAIGGLAITTVFSSQALASCFDLSSVKMPGKGGSLQASFTSPAKSGVRFESLAADGPDIVGLWQFRFASVGNQAYGLNDGDTLDAGFAQWHSDGTEIMNSGKDPATSNFCLGTYASEGHRTYKLNHFALSWDNAHMFCTPKPGAPSCFVGVANIVEEVTVDPHGDNYTGHVTVTQYDTNNNVLAVLTGNVTATRIKPDGQ